MPSYLTSIGTISLSRTVFEIFDFKVFRVWPWPLNFGGHLRSKIFSLFESPIYDFLFNSHWHFLSISYRFEIFDFKVFRVWPWPLTFRGHLRSNIFSPFESPYMTSYLTPIDTFSLYRTVLEIFDIKVFRVWSWPLTFRGHPRSKIFQLFESSYMTSYLTPIDTFSLSRTVFEIFDFKSFRVWSWPLTFKGDPRSKIFSPFESPYMTSYLTPIDTFSLSRNVFEIFDFKVFRVWPWPLTFGVTLGQKYFRHSKAHIWLSIQLPLTLSLYLVPFLRYSAIAVLEDIIRVYSLPFSSMTSQMNIFAFKRFCTLQGFRKYRNEVSSPSNSIVIGVRKILQGFRGFESPTSGSSLVKKCH